LLPGKTVEPLILRANAGDCINVTLKNKIPNKPLNAGGTSVFGIPVYTSPEVGLHPQLVALDITRSNTGISQQSSKIHSSRIRFHTADSV
jgi:hypothetical protein